MSRKNLPFFCFLFFLSAAASCEASSVSRSFSNTTIYMAENITVNLTVSITAGETFYAIDESYPSGWTIVSTAGDANQSGHVKWAAIQNATNTVSMYIIRAPSQPRNYTFSGIYMFENMTAEATISGPSVVTVRAKGDINNDNCVDISDLSTIAIDFGKTSGFINPNSDTNKNGVVDIFDLVVVGKEFGAGC